MKKGLVVFGLFLISVGAGAGELANCLIFFNRLPPVSNEYPVIGQISSVVLDQNRHVVFRGDAAAVAAYLAKTKLNGALVTFDLENSNSQIFEIDLAPIVENKTNSSTVQTVGVASTRGPSLPLNLGYQIDAAHEIDLVCQP